MTDTINTITNKDDELNTKKDYSDIFSFLIPDIGDVVNNRYKLEDEIGKGGFGVVFKGFDNVLKKTVALKFLSPKVTDNDRKFLRVRREVNLSQKITDDRVVKIFSLEQYENDKGKLHFIIMEFLEGRTLDSIIKEKGKLTWDEFKPLFFEILEGVGLLHHYNIIHRDLKPSNIIVNEGKIKILDFGLSKEIDDREKTSSLHEIVGSPQYMSPEQVTEPDIDFKSDIYQLGLILYRALTGIFPFESESNTMDMIFKRINEEPKSLKDAGIKAPIFLEFGLTKALEKKSVNRFTSIEDMQDYFKKEQYPVFGKTFRMLRKKPLLYISVVIFILLSIFFYLKFSNIFVEIGRVDYNDNTIEIYSKAGTKLYKKRFIDSNIVYAKKQYINNNHIGTRNHFINQEGVVIFTTPVKKDYIGKKRSFIDSSAFIYNYVLIKDKGQYLLLKNRLFGGLNKSQIYYDFANSYYLNDFTSRDLDGDGQDEIIFYLKNSFQMFPTVQFILFKGVNFFTLFNPGIFSFIDSKKNKDNLSILLTGYNNIICHLKFIAINRYKIPFQIRNNGFEKSTIDGDIVFPSLSDSININFKGLFIFLPRGSKIIDNKWFDTRGSIKFTLLNEPNKSIEVFNDNRIEIREYGKTTSFIDDKETLNKVYNLIDQYYKVKTKSRNYIEALKHLYEAKNIEIKNPWLKSAILYLIGDLKIRMGKNEEGEKFLIKSLNIYPKNIDAFQRLCELKFLQNKNYEAFKLVSEVKADMSSFWGLWTVGKKLFKIYTYLHNGEYIKSEDMVLSLSKKNSSSKTQFEKIINSIPKFFKGNYAEAEQMLNSARDKMPSPYTLIEFRLLFSRTVILNQQFNIHNKAPELLALAKFYIKDIAINSISSNHLARISRAYFLALDGQKREAGIMAKEGFEEILKMSKGDFFTRFWLFYDAFMYGKTMEILDNKKEAIRGYKECIKANPYTDLAKRAKKSAKIF